jgi:hemoglobin
MALPDIDVYTLIEDEGFQRLVAAFYTLVPTDPILGPLYDQRNLQAAEWRLREFLIGRFGGPRRYIENRGHPRLRMRHHPFKINKVARDRWISLMSTALEQTQLPAVVEETLRRYFNDTATFLINQD